MYRVKNLSRRLRRNEIDFSQANAIFPEAAKGFEDFVISKGKPRKKRTKKVGGSAFEFGVPSPSGEPTVRDRKFRTESFVERGLRDKLQGR